MRETSRALYLFHGISQIFFTLSLFSHDFIDNDFDPVFLSIGLLHLLLCILQDFMVMESWYSLDSEMLISPSHRLSRDSIDISSEHI